MDNKILDGDALASESDSQPTIKKRGRPSKKGTEAAVGREYRCGLTKAEEARLKNVSTEKKSEFARKAILERIEKLEKQEQAQQTPLTAEQMRLIEFMSKNEVSKIKLTLIDMVIDSPDKDKLMREMRDFLYSNFPANKY